MGEPAPKPYVTHADYLAREAKSDTKHEWLDGVIYDMSGGTPVCRPGRNSSGWAR